MSYLRIASLGVFIFILAGCQLNEQSIPPDANSEGVLSPTHTSEPLSCEEVEGSCFLLVLDSELNCSYRGPEILETGATTMLFINEGDGIARVNLMRHKGDKTIQDMKDYLGEEPSRNHSPDWVFALGPWENVGPGKRHTSIVFLEPGIYTMVCADTRYGWWLGGGFSVEE